MPENVTEGSSSNANGDIANGDAMNGSYGIEKPSESLRAPENDKEMATDTAASEDTGPRDRNIPSGEEGNGRAGHRLTAFLRNRRKPKDVENQKAPNDSDTDEPKKPQFSAWSQIRYSLFNSWVNILLVCVPIGIALHFVESINPIVVFVVNFIAIIPLAGTLSYATEEIALRTGETIGGLLNATFG